MLLRQQLLDLIWQEGYRVTPPDDRERDEQQLAIKGLATSCLEKGKPSRSVTATSLTGSDKTGRVDCHQGKSDGQLLSRGLRGGAISDGRVPYPEGCLDDSGGVDGDSRGGGSSSGEGKEGVASREDTAERGPQKKGKGQLQSGKAARTEQSGASVDTEELEGGRKRGSWSCTQGDAQVRKHLQVTFT